MRIWGFRGWFRVSYWKPYVDFLISAVNAIFRSPDLRPQRVLCGCATGAALDGKRSGHLDEVERIVILPSSLGFLRPKDG
jgi:hypothetical protein